MPMAAGGTSNLASNAATRAKSSPAASTGGYTSSQFNSNKAAPSPSSSFRGAPSGGAVRTQAAPVGRVTDPYGGMGKMGMRSGQTSPFNEFAVTAPQRYAERSQPQVVARLGDDGRLSMVKDQSRLPGMAQPPGNQLEYPSPEGQIYGPAALASYLQPNKQINDQIPLTSPTSIAQAPAAAPFRNGVPAGHQTPSPAGYTAPGTVTDYFSQPTRMDPGVLAQMLKGLNPPRPSSFAARPGAGMAQNTGSGIHSPSPGRNAPSGDGRRYPRWQQ